MDCQKSLRHFLRVACNLARRSSFFPSAELIAGCALIALAFTSQTGAISPATNAPAEPISATTRAMRHDAALHDVCFVNTSLGWAVGDRGVIWHTRDGGTTWREQPSNVSCSLQALCFLDADRGWAVGGEHRPGTSTTRGAILRTQDGGATWTAVPQLVLPRLMGVKFFDPKHGVAFGDRISSSPSGAYATRDGGATWQPLIADQAAGWLTGDFLDPNTGALAGPAGSIATLARNKLVHSPLASASLRSLRDMQLVAPTGGWAVGDGGLVLTTNDLGRSWQTPPTDLPETTEYSDFDALAVVGSQVWVAGTPGSVIYHSSDAGQTWEAFSTGQTTPIRALTFASSTHGWAVGDLGRILVTQDGGRTWQPQRNAASRAALLALCTQPAEIPLELLADSGAADGYIAAVNLLCTPSSTDGAVAGTHRAVATSEPANEALLLAGAASVSSAWRFPLPPADLALTPAQLLESLNRENDGRALHQLETHIIRQLRIWRPDVIITTSSGPGDRGRTHASPQSNDDSTSSSLAGLIEQLLAQAIPAAADPASHPELASEIGLAPWQVKKVYGVLPTGARGEEMLATGRFSPWLGAALSDFVAPARSLLSSTQVAPPDTYELKLLFSSIAADTNARGIFGGLSLAPGSDARRPQADLPTQDLESLRRLATRRRHVQELIERTQGNAAWAGQVSSMIEGLNPDDAGQLLIQLAEGYRKTGRLDLAADTYFLFAQRCPDHSLVDGALTWLVQFYASSEIAHRLKTTQGEPTSRTRTSGEPALAGGSPQEIQPASATLPTTTANSLSRDDRLRRAAQLADYLQSARPAIYAEPSVRFAETTAQRELGFANPAQRFYLSLRQLPASDPWRECAATEEWLAQPADLPPAKKLATCRAADVPPLLDGNLNEPFWSKADRLRLIAGPDRTANSPPGEVQIARDAQFLYIAVHCRKSPACNYPKDESPRPHDADLANFDRLTLRLDTDRDYNTSFEFSVDSRGHTRDACWEDATWNPAWYVAAAADDDFWTIEAAIPLAEIADKPPTPRQVWAVSARRTIPSVGYETWAGDATTAASPHQFGLLIFE